MQHLICPLCGGLLEKETRRYLCASGHSFDISAAGHLNLHISGKSGEHIGDNKAMVAARRDFLRRGYYAPLQERVCQLADGLAGGGLVVDCGCGEGYYTAAISALCPCIGLDISKFAVLAAAKADKNAIYVVASSFALPLATGCASLVTSLFAPLASCEFARVLKVGGAVLAVVPGPRHLWELKAAVYDTAYENNSEKHVLEGFHLVDTQILSYTAEILGAEAIAQLFSMTPYAFKTSREGLERLATLTTLKCTMEFHILILQKDDI